MGKIVEVKNLSFSYGDMSIYQNLSFDVVSETICTILGPTGSGKSTLARILAGVQPVPGNIKIFGFFLNPKNVWEIRKKTGFVCENMDSQFVDTSVLEEFSFSLQKQTYSEQEILDRINKICTEFQINHLLSRNMRELSGGEIQIVMLVSVLLTEPELLILDEALSMIDKKTKQRIWKILRKYQKEYQFTIMHFTHDVEDALEGTDILVLAEGQILLQEKKLKALQNEKIFTSHKIPLPFMAELSNKLRYYNTISEIQIDKKKLVDALWK